MHKTALPLVACLLALCATGASAQSYWKWRDAKGQVHIGDTPPPPSTPAKDILARPSGVPAPAETPAAPAASPAASEAAPMSDLQKRKQQADKEKADAAASAKAEQDRKNAALRADNCQRAQQQAKALQSGVRVARMSATGEREYLDDAGRAAELKRSQDIINQSCGPASTN